MVFLLVSIHLEVGLTWVEHHFVPILKSAVMEGIKAGANLQYTFDICASDVASRDSKD